MTNDADERLLDDLRRSAARHDAPPEPVRAAARAAFTWRTIDEELAALAYDSRTQPPAAAGARSDSTRTLGFESDGRGIELEVVERGEHRLIVGQMLPPCPGRVEIRCGGVERTVEAEADRLGRFHAEGLPAGPVRLRCLPEDGAPITTTWFTI